MATHLVTGGAGFIGSSIAERLLAAGDTVRVLDDFSTGRRENLERLTGRLELVEATIGDPDAVRKAMRGVDVVFHQAALPSVARSIEAPAATMMVNVQGTTIVLEAASQAGVRRVIYAASSSAYGDTPTLPKVESMPPAPLSPYAVSKLAGEHLARVYAQVYGLETVSLRYFNVYGPRQNPNSPYAAVIPSFVAACLTGRPPVIHGDGEQTRDFCFVDDCVTANLLAASAPGRLAGEVINVARGERTSMNELLRVIAEETGTRPVPERRPSRPGDVRDALADIGRARDLIGYAPSVDVRDGLRRTIAALRASIRPPDSPATAPAP